MYEEEGCSRPNIEILNLGSINDLNDLNDLNDPGEQSPGRNSSVYYDINIGPKIELKKKHLNQNNIVSNSICNHKRAISQIQNPDLNININVNELNEVFPDILFPNQREIKNNENSISHVIEVLKIMVKMICELIIVAYPFIIGIFSIYIGAIAIDLYSEYSSIKYKKSETEIIAISNTPIMLFTIMTSYTMTACGFISVGFTLNAFLQYYKKDMLFYKICIIIGNIIMIFGTTWLCVYSIYLAQNDLKNNRQMWDFISEEFAQNFNRTFGLFISNTIFTFNDSGVSDFAEDVFKTYENKIKYFLENNLYDVYGDETGGANLRQYRFATASKEVQRNLSDGVFQIMSIEFPEILVSSVTPFYAELGLIGYSLEYTLLGTVTDLEVNI